MPLSTFLRTFVVIFLIYVHQSLSLSTVFSVLEGALFAHLIVLSINTILYALICMNLRSLFSSIKQSPDELAIMVMLC